MRQRRQMPRKKEQMLSRSLGNCGMHPGFNMGFMSYSLNSLKRDFVGKYIGDSYRGYEGGY